MDNTPIYGCNGCSGSAGRMGCGTHGPNRVIISNPLESPAPPFFTDTAAAVLAERDRCRKIAADHIWKCIGKDCDCARTIAYDIMDVAR